jgi:hypothetical protein
MRNLHLSRAPSLLSIFWAIILSTLLIVFQARPVSAASGGVPVLLNFENLPAGTPVFNQYIGVTFLGGDSTNPDGTHPIVIEQSTQATISPTQVLRSNLGLGCEFCGSHLTLRFDQPQYRVSLSTGLVPILFNPPVNETLLLQGFSSNPTTPGAVLITQRVAPCLGTRPTPVTTPLEIDDNAARILYARLSLVSCSNTNQGPDGGTILIDNLLYDRPLHPPAHESDPPIITVTSPTNSSTVMGSIPGELRIALRATITETDLSSLTAQVNSHPPVLVSYSHITPQTYSAMVDLESRDGLVNGSNTLTLTAKDFDRPSNSASTRITFTYQVKPLPPPSLVDIMPTAVEVTQSIDPGPVPLLQVNANPHGFGYLLDFGGDPPLIKGKRTLIRVYSAAANTTSPVGNVPATMYVSHDLCTSNCAIPGAQGVPPLFPPLLPGSCTPPSSTPSTTLSVNTAGITVPPLGMPDSVPAQVINKGTADLCKTWNFWLEPDWTMSDLVVSVRINSGGYSNFPMAPSVAECTSPERLTCRDNNDLELHLHFLPLQHITINPVYLHVSDKTPQPYQVDAIFQLFNEVYPVQVDQGQRFDRTISPDMSGDDVLDFMNDNFGSDNNSEFFLGIFPGDQGNFAANNGGTLGEAPHNGGQVAWANANNPFAAVHEVGHDIGFDHWGCGHGPDDDECGVLPIAHGGIGIFGTDILKWRVILPGDMSNPNNGSHAHDFMTAYQQQIQWVSWYTYDILLSHHTVESYDAEDPPALLVRGSISASGVVTLRPLYQIDVNHPLSDTIVEDDPNDLYTLQGYDSAGNTLFVHNFEPFKRDLHTADYGKALIIREVVPVLPNLQRIELRKGARVLGSLMNPAPGQGPSVSITAPVNGTVWPVGKLQTIRWTSSSPAGVPLYTFVQYSPDGGKTRITLGRDIKGSELMVNPDELPGSTNAMIYVQVSDGMNTGSAAAGPFTVLPKSPSVHIVTPSAHTQLPAHIPIALEGTAYDLQESLNDTEFRWSSDRDGLLGTGRLLTVWKLSVGQHTLTLTVTDSHGRVARDAIQIEVGVSQPPPFDWRIFWAVAIALLLLVLVVAVILRQRWRRT